MEPRLRCSEGRAELVGFDSYSVTDAHPLSVRYSVQYSVPSVQGVECCLGWTCNRNISREVTGWVTLSPALQYTQI